MLLIRYYYILAKEVCGFTRYLVDAGGTIRPCAHKMIYYFTKKEDFSWQKPKITIGFLFIMQSALS